MNIQVHLFGSLRKRRQPPWVNPLDLPAAGSASLAAILNELRIDPEMIHLVMVNHRAVPRGHVIQPGDRVSLFPKEYAIFIDWKDFRMR